MPHKGWHAPWNVFHGNWTGAYLSGGELVPNKLAPLYRDVRSVDALDDLAKHHDLELAESQNIFGRVFSDGKFVAGATTLAMHGNPLAAIAAMAVPLREVSHQVLGMF